MKSTRTAPGSQHNGQYRRMDGKPASNQTIDTCSAPVETLARANGVPQHFVFQDLGDKPPPTAS